MAEEAIVTKMKIDGTPEQFAAFLIDWCRRNYTSYGMVPRLKFDDAGSLWSIEGVTAPDDVVIAFGFDEAFAMLNDGKKPEEFDFDPGHRYVFRRSGKVNDRYVRASVYHRIGEDGLTALCGAVKAGENGYEIVIKDKPLLQSRLCNNCLRGITVAR